MIVDGGGTAEVEEVTGWKEIWGKGRSEEKKLWVYNKSNAEMEMGGSWNMQSDSLAQC